MSSVIVTLESILRSMSVYSNIDGAWFECNLIQFGGIVFYLSMTLTRESQSEWRGWLYGDVSVTCSLPNTVVNKTSVSQPK